MTKKVNFVIFVVSGLSVLNAMDSEADDGYDNMIATMFNCPFLSLKGTKTFLLFSYFSLLTSASLMERLQFRVFCDNHVSVSYFLARFIALYGWLNLGGRKGLSYNINNTKIV